METSSMTPTPKFPFPFPPYHIQEQFMSELYGVLEAGKVGIFESPTGTGKSLSLICGSLSWLRDFEEKKRREEALALSGGDAEKNIDQDAGDSTPSTTSSSTEPDWITQFLHKKEEIDLKNKIRQSREPGAKDLTSFCRSASWKVKVVQYVDLYRADLQKEVRTAGARDSIVCRADGGAVPPYNKFMHSLKAGEKSFHLGM